MSEEKQVVIIGGGFGGLNATRVLANRDDLQVVLIDQRNHHLFQPLLYQVATAGLNPSDIAQPIRSQFSKAKNVHVHLGRVNSVDLKGRSVSGENDLQMGYDYLILACGAQHSYFGKPEWEEFAPGLKTIEQATEIRRRILSAFEIAETEENPEKQKSLLTFVIVGGGPTGVELAGVKDFRRINPASARILLVEALPRVLASFSEDLSRHAAADLAKLGVEVRLSSVVERIDADAVQVGSERIPAGNTFWAAGVQAEKISKTLGVELDRAGRIVVQPDLSIPGHPEAFGVGDIAHLDLGGGKTLPGLAPVAIQAGRTAARNILASIEGKPRVSFRYRDKGQMATIGKRRAIAQTGRLKFTGFPAWIAWLFVHIFYLIGFKNRITVFLEWSWSYLFSKRGARLITTKEWRSR